MAQFHSNSFKHFHVPLERTIRRSPTSLAIHVHPSVGSYVIGHYPTDLNKTWDGGPTRIFFQPFYFGLTCISFV
jgi:hypothetical protein